MRPGRITPTCRAMSRSKRSSFGRRKPRAPCESPGDESCTRERATTFPNSSGPHASGPLPIDSTRIQGSGPPCASGRRHGARRAVPPVHVRIHRDDDRAADRHRDHVELATSGSAIRRHGRVVRTSRALRDRAPVDLQLGRRDGALLHSGRGRSAVPCAVRSARSVDLQAREDGDRPGLDATVLLGLHAEFLPIVALRLHRPDPDLGDAPAFRHGDGPGKPDRLRINLHAGAQDRPGGRVDRAVRGIWPGRPSRPGPGDPRAGGGIARVLGAAGADGAVRGLHSRDLRQGAYSRTCWPGAPGRWRSIWACWS